MKTHRLFHLFLWLVLALAGTGLRAVRVQPFRGVRFLRQDAEQAETQHLQEFGESELGRGRILDEQHSKRHTLPS